MRLMPVEKEQWFLMLEQKVSELCYSCAQLVEPPVHRHIEHGFARRLYMLQTSRMYFEELFSDNRSKPLEAHEATLAALHANSLYVGIRGALDNLAWALQFKFSLFGGVTETEGDRAKIDLFRECFVKAIENRLPVLGRKVRAKKEWALDLKKFRDPAAHRIPIYVPPGVISPEQVNNIVEAMSIDKASASGGPDQPYAEINQFVKPVPVMVLGGEQLAAYPLFDQVKRDYRHYLSVSRAVICEIKANC